MPLLFSYGSNHPAQLMERLGHSVVSQPAFVEGRQRVFRGRSERWGGGGVASLQQKDIGVTYGYVADVTSADLEMLDQYEGVASGIYMRRTVKVRIPASHFVHAREAIAYVALSREFHPPSPEYLAAVLKTIEMYWRVPGGVQDIPIR
jgi:cation transport regulator ChaC